MPVCANKILTALQLDYVDLLLLHWPFSFQQQDESLFPTDPATNQVIGSDVDFFEAYQALEGVQEAGLTRSIGVSNFTVDQLRQLLQVARIKPVTNQVELHPYLVQSELKTYCNDNGIVLTAYSPLGNPGSAVNPDVNKDRLLRDPVINRLATKYGKNAGQILIKYQVATGNLVIPKSVNRDRIVSNIQVFDFDLTPEEVAEVTALDRNYRSCFFTMTSHLRNYPFN